MSKGKIKYVQGTSLFSGQCLPGVYRRHLWQHRAPEREPGVAPRKMPPCVSRPHWNRELGAGGIALVPMGGTVYGSVPGEDSDFLGALWARNHPIVGSQNGFSTGFSMTTVGCVALPKVHSVQCLDLTLIVSPGVPRGGVEPTRWWVP